MPCSCEGVTCSCGIPCYCPGSTCGCTNCENSANRSCSLCNLPIIYNDITENVCLCFRNHQTAENRILEPWRSDMMHEGYILMYDNILKYWVPVIVQHSNLTPPTSQVRWIYHQTQNCEKLDSNGLYEFVKISNPTEGGISHEMDYTSDPFRYTSYGSLEDNVSNPTEDILYYVPLNVDTANKPVGAVVLTDERKEKEIIPNSTRSTSNIGLLGATHTNESLKTEIAKNSILATGLKRYTLMDPDLRDLNITNDWLGSFL